MRRGEHGEGFVKFSAVDGAEITVIPTWHSDGAGAQGASTISSKSRSSEKSEWSSLD